MDIGPLRDALTVLLGVATGVLSGLFGVGGGVISQPGMRLLGLEPLMVIGTALPVIIPGALSGMVRYRREDFLELGGVHGGSLPRRLSRTLWATGLAKLPGPRSTG